MTQILPPAGEVARSAGGGRGRLSSTSPSVVSSSRHLPRWGEDRYPQAFSTKLSMTFFSPALSKATVSLLPSTPETLP